MSGNDSEGEMVTSGTTQTGLRMLPTLLCSDGLNIMPLTMNLGKAIVCWYDASAMLYTVVDCI